jgi:hypothetical protein
MAGVLRPLIPAGSARARDVVNRQPPPPPPRRVSLQMDMASPGRRDGSSPGRRGGGEEGAASAATAASQSRRSPGRAAAAAHHGVMQGMRFSSPDVRAKLERRARAGRRTVAPPRPLTFEDDSPPVASSSPAVTGAAGAAPHLTAAPAALGTATRWTLRFQAPPVWAAPAVAATGGSLAGVGGAAELTVQAAAAVAQGLAAFLSTALPTPAGLSTLPASPLAATAGELLAATGCTVYPVAAWGQGLLEVTAGAASRLNQRIAAEWRSHAASVTHARAWRAQQIVRSGGARAPVGANGAGKSARPAPTVAGTSSTARSGAAPGRSAAAVLPSAVEVVSAAVGSRSGASKSQALARSAHLDRAEKRFVHEFLSARRNSRAVAPKPSHPSSPPSEPPAVGAKRKGERDGGEAPGERVTKVPRSDRDDHATRATRGHAGGDGGGGGGDGDGDSEGDSEGGSVSASVPAGGDDRPDARDPPPSPRSHSSASVARGWERDLAEAVADSEWWGDGDDDGEAARPPAHHHPRASTASGSAGGLERGAGGLHPAALHLPRLPAWWPGVSTDAAAGGGFGSRAAVAFLGGGAVSAAPDTGLAPPSSAVAPAAPSLDSISAAPLAGDPGPSRRTFGLAALGASRAAAQLPTGLGSTVGGPSPAGSAVATTAALAGPAPVVAAGAPHMRAPHALGELAAGQADCIADWTARCLLWQQAFASAVHGLLAGGGRLASDGSPMQVVVRFPGSAPVGAGLATSPWDGGNAVVFAWLPAPGTAAPQLTALVSRSSRALRMALRQHGVAFSTPLQPAVASSDTHVDPAAMAAALDAVASEPAADGRATDALALAPSVRALARAARGGEAAPRLDGAPGGRPRDGGTAAGAGVGADALAGTPASAASLLLVSGVDAVLALARALQASHLPTAPLPRASPAPPSPIAVQPAVPPSLWCVDLSSSSSISTRCRHWDVPQIASRGVLMAGGAVRHAACTSAVTVGRQLASPGDAAAAGAAAAASGLAYEVTGAGVVFVAPLRLWARRLTDSGVAAELVVVEEAGQARWADAVTA